MQIATYFASKARFFDPHRYNKFVFFEIIMKEKSFFREVSVSISI